MAFTWKQDPTIAQNDTISHAAMWNEIVTNVNTLKTQLNNANPACTNYSAPCNSVLKTTTNQTKCNSVTGTTVTPVAQNDTTDSNPVCSSHNKKTTCSSDTSQGVPGGAWSSATVTPVSVEVEDKILYSNPVDTAKGVINLTDQLHTSSYCTTALSINRTSYFSTKKATVYGTYYTTYKHNYDTGL